MIVRVIIITDTHVFLKEIFLLENEPQKPRNLKKIFKKKSLASNAWPAIFKNTIFKRAY